jgi:hydrogenase expression/formation protein HypC
MCLAIPGRVIEAFEKGGMRMARVQFGGVAREACLVPDTKLANMYWCMYCLTRHSTA